MTYYVTKYGLSDGIWVVDDEYCQVDKDGKYMYIKAGYSMGIQVPTRDFFTNLAAAEDRISALKDKRLRAIEREKQKLKKDVPHVQWTPNGLKAIK